MSMEHWWSDTDRGKLKYSVKNLSQCHPAHYVLQTDRSRASVLKRRRLTALDTDGKMSVAEGTAWTGKGKGKGHPTTGLEGPEGE
jgi:hypothetical protein